MFLQTAEDPTPGVAQESVRSTYSDTVRALNFVPYYFRANRAGKGHMRVGLRRRKEYTDPNEYAVQNGSS